MRTYATRGRGENRKKKIRDRETFNHLCQVDSIYHGRSIIIDPVTLPRVEWPRDVTDRRSGRRTSKRTRPIRGARDHHKLSRAVGLASSRVAASPRRGSERDASVAIYLPLPLLISRDVPPTRRSSSRTHDSYCPRSSKLLFSHAECIP